jgi:anti-sigma factor RsiW
MTMSEPLSHSEIEGLLAPFALDAVDADEHQAVAGHLLGCPACRAEVGEYRRAAADFGRSEVPTDEEWDRLAGGLE